MPSRRDGDAEQHRAAAQSPTAIAAVADDAAERAGEEVHHAEGAGGDARGLPGSGLKVVDEIERGDIVDGQFHAEAGGVEHGQRPDAAVAACFPECSGGRGASAWPLRPQFRKSPSAVSCVRK